MDNTFFDNHAVLSDELDPDVLAGAPPVDLTISGIGDLLDYHLSALLGAATDVAATQGSDECFRPCDSQHEQWTHGLITSDDS